MIYMNRLLAMLLAACLFTGSLSAQPAVSVSVNPASGTYTVRASPSGWSFTGSVGQPLVKMVQSRGSDSGGAYSTVSFSWNQGVAYSASIRWYDARPVVMFSLSVPQGLQGRPMETFPDFTTIPPALGRFSYHNRIFPLPQFFLEETSTPWMLFNKSGDACVLSPASDFMVSLMQKKGDSSRIASGLNPEVQQLPAGFTHSSVMVIDKGIRHAWDTWGAVLRKLYGRIHPSTDQDVLLKYFGFWTDVGGDYYYTYDTAKGYAGTLLALRDHYREQGIPLGYIQLDSWWYQKSSNNVYNQHGAEKKMPNLPGGAWNKSGGLMEYTADPFLFPEGLQAFQKKLGLPLVTHNRWIDPASPYHDRFRISGLGATDPKFWEEIMDYLKRSGVSNYEQDWINYIYMNNPQMISDLNTANAFTDGMARAAVNRGINLQYCMGLPRYFMQGVKYNNLTTIRAAGDRFKRERWKNFVFTSQLAYEMGIYPWSDVFKSGETGNLVMSVLSAGPVGTGDKVGTENKANILKACRADGVLVKPDAPLLPLDQNYIHLNAGKNGPITASTYTDHHGLRTGYMVAFTEEGMLSREFSFRLEDIGISRRSALYDPVRNTISYLAPGQLFSGSVADGDSLQYYIVAPVNTSGIALFGDVDKIASTGKQRIPEIIAEGKGMKIKLAFAPGESSLRIAGYSKDRLRSPGNDIEWDKASGLFTVVMKAPMKGMFREIVLDAAR